MRARPLIEWNGVHASRKISQKYTVYLRMALPSRLQLRVHVACGCADHAQPTGTA